MIYTLEEIRSRTLPIIRKYRIPAMYAFGSYARGQASEEGDLDFLVDTTGAELTSLLLLVAGILFFTQGSGSVERVPPEIADPMPHFVMGGETYWYWSRRERTEKIPNGYILAGEIQKEAEIYAVQNFEASGLLRGTKIYLNADAVWEAAADSTGVSPYLAACVPYRVAEASQIYLRYHGQLFVGLSELSDSFEDRSYYQSFDPSLYAPERLPPDARLLGEALQVERSAFPKGELETNYDGSAEQLMVYIQGDETLYLQAGETLIVFVPYCINAPK